MQKGMRLNDGHVTYLGLLAKKDGARKGYLSKRSSDNTKWHTKWFALLQNMLFYFETDSSSRPSGLYLLEGCVCDRAPSPKPSLSAKDSLEKQVGARGPAEPQGDARRAPHRHRHRHRGARPRPPPPGLRRRAPRPPAAPCPAAEPPPPGTCPRVTAAGDGAGVSGERVPGGPPGAGTAGPRWRRAPGQRVGVHRGGGGPGAARSPPCRPVTAN